MENQFPSKDLEVIIKEFTKTQHMIARTRTVCDSQPCKNGARCENQEDSLDYTCYCRQNGVPLKNACGKNCECCEGYRSVFLVGGYYICQPEDLVSYLPWYIAKPENWPDKSTRWPIACVFFNLQEKIKIFLNVSFSKMHDTSPAQYDSIKDPSEVAQIPVFDGENSVC